jgi:hypothetical protein
MVRLGSGGFTGGKPPVARAQGDCPRVRLKKFPERMYPFAAEESLNRRAGPEPPSAQGPFARCRRYLQRKDVTHPLDRGAWRRQ